jgi:hypothetical protein
MAVIVITDLSENMDLDRKAMQAIAGGARWRSQGGAGGSPGVRGQRIVDFHTRVRGGAAPANPSPPPKAPAR